MARFKIDDAALQRALKKVEDGVAAKLGSGVEVPLEVSEDEAVAAVRKQLRDAGVTPNDTEVRRMVRDARK